MIDHRHLQRERSRHDFSILDVDDFSTLALIRHFDDAHFDPPHPLPLKWIGLAVQMRTIGIMQPSQYGFRSKLSSIDRRIVVTLLHTSHR
jgi:hypothetical protein